MRTYLFAALCWLVFALPLGGSGKKTPPEQALAHRNFLHNSLDSLIVTPRPVVGLEGGNIRWGLQFSVLKTLLPGPGVVRPFLETGITIFDKIDASPHNKKHLFLSGGLLLGLGKWGVSLDGGYRYGSGRSSGGLGLGVWRFFPYIPKPEAKTMKDFGSAADYFRWKRRQAKPPLFRGFALSLRLTRGFNMEPGWLAGIGVDFFL